MRGRGPGHGVIHYAHSIGVSISRANPEEQPDGKQHVQASENLHREDASRR